MSYSNAASLNPFTKTARSHATTRTQVKLLLKQEARPYVKRNTISTHETQAVSIDDHTQKLDTVVEKDEYRSKNSDGDRILSREKANSKIHAASCVSINDTADIKDACVVDVDAINPSSTTKQTPVRGAQIDEMGPRHSRSSKVKAPLEWFQEGYTDDESATTGSTSNGTRQDFYKDIDVQSEGALVRIASQDTSGGYDDNTEERQEGRETSDANSKRKPISLQNSASKLVHFQVMSPFGTPTDYPSCTAENLKQKEKQRKVKWLNQYLPAIISRSTSSLHLAAKTYTNDVFTITDINTLHKRKNSKQLSYTADGVDTKRGNSQQAYPRLAVTRETNSTAYNPKAAHNARTDKWSTYGVRSRPVEDFMHSRSQDNKHVDYLDKSRSISNSVGIKGTGQHASSCVINNLKIAESVYNNKVK